MGLRSIGGYRILGFCMIDSLLESYLTFLFHLLRVGWILGDGSDRKGFRGRRCFGCLLCWGF